MAAAGAHIPNTVDEGLVKVEHEGWDVRHVGWQVPEEDFPVDTANTRRVREATAAKATSQTHREGSLNLEKNPLKVSLASSSTPSVRVTSLRESPAATTPAPPSTAHRAAP